MHHWCVKAGSEHYLTEKIGIVRQASSGQALERIYWDIHQAPASPTDSCCAQQLSQKQLPAVGTPGVVLVGARDCV